jgi:hypothetical protein
MKATITITLLMLAGSITGTHAQNTFPSAGNVGIGTAAPSTNLQVIGGADFTNGYIRLTHNTPYGDANDGKICNSVFAQGLNIVGINNDNTYRKVQLWGGITQNQNDGGNSFVGTTSLTGPIFLRGNTEITDGTSFKIVHDTPYGDVNDGKIGNSLFAQGLNIVGINNDNTYRKIQVWGGITQNQNDGGNSFAGNSNFSSTVRIGNVTTPAGYKLYVEQGILTEKVKVAIKTSANWADYVFDKNYKMMPLAKVEKYIQQNKHLPGIPSAKEVVKDGIDLAQINAKLLAKVEELTLYMIDFNKQVKAQDKKITLQQKEIAALKKKGN